METKLHSFEYYDVIMEDIQDKYIDDQEVMKIFNDAVTHVIDSALDPDIQAFKAKYEQIVDPISTKPEAFNDIKQAALAALAMIRLELRSMK